MSDSKPAKPKHLTDSGIQRKAAESQKIVAFVEKTNIILSSATGIVLKGAKPPRASTSAQ